MGYGCQAVHHMWCFVQDGGAIYSTKGDVVMHTNNSFMHNSAEDVSGSGVGVAKCVRCGCPRY